VAQKTSRRYEPVVTLWKRKVFCVERGAERKVERAERVAWVEGGRTLGLGSAAEGWMRRVKEVEGAARAVVPRRRRVVKRFIFARGGDDGCGGMVVLGESCCREVTECGLVGLRQGCLIGSRFRWGAELGLSQWVGHYKNPVRSYIKKPTQN
jgi:hypothetical protein